MNKCVLTKLPGTFNDNSLIRFDVLPITLKKLATESSDDQTITVTVTGSQTARIVGDARFQDSSRTEDLGQEIQLTSGLNTIYLSNDDGVLYISGKSLITTVGIGRSSYVPLASVALQEIKYCSDNFVRLIGITGGCYGDIQDLSEMINIMYLSMAASNIYGDVSALSSLNSLAYLSVAGCPNIIGDISEAFSDKTSLTYLGCSGCSNLDPVDLADFRDLTNLYSIRLSKDVEMEYSVSSGRSASSTVIALEGVTLGTDLDNYLIDNAPCLKSPNTSLISVYGTKTSASSSAISTLKTKGYVVQINGVNQ